MMRSLLEKYQMGMITDHQLVVDSLIRIDPADPAPILSSLPENILRFMLRFVNEYEDGRMVTNYGELPSRNQIEAARNWIEESIQQKVNKIA